MWIQCICGYNLDEEIEITIGDSHLSFQRVSASELSLRRCSKAFAENHSLTLPRLVLAQGYKYEIVDICASAFAGSGLVRISLSASVRTIGVSTFANTSALESVDLAATQIKIIPNCCFAYSSVEEVRLPPSLVRLCATSFSYSQIRSLDFPPALASIEDSVFSNCENIARINLGITAIRHISKFAFFGCAGLLEISLPESLASIDDGAFARSGLETFSAPVLRKLRS
jgi:hypothetical protein